MAYNSLSLTACSFHLRPLYSTNEYYDLNKNITCGKNKEHTKDVFSLIKEFFKVFSSVIDDKSSKTTFRCEEISEVVDKERYRYVYLKIKSGDYGSSSDIVNKDSDEVAYKKDANQTEERPFILYIVVPKGSKKVIAQKGIMFFQNVGGYGIKTITSNYMRKLFSDEYNIKLNFRTIVPELFIKKCVTKENLGEIIMIKNGISEDTADKTYNGYGQEVRRISKLCLSKSKWDDLHRKIKFFSESKYNLFEFENNNYDDLKLKLKMGERDRIINMNNLENLSIIESIPDNIKDKGGHPKIDSLLEHFEKVTVEYLNEMTYQIN